MVDPEWQGGKKDQRLYRKVRAEKQKVIRKKYDVIQAHLNERGRRLWAGSEAISFGQGGIRAVAEALAMSQKTVIQGRRELEGKSPGKPGEGVLTGGAGSGERTGDASRPWSGNRGVGGSDRDDRQSGDAGRSDEAAEMDLQKA